MIVGFCGRAGCGKSTAALYLEDHYGYETHKFAGPLKRMLRELGLSNYEIEGDLKELPCELLGGATPRHAMQTLGTEWGRDTICADLWVRAWAASLPRREGIVADDVRFENEAAKIKEFGGRIVEIRRPDHSPVSSGHPSERFSFAPDLTIVNDGTLRDLGAKIDRVLG